MATTTIIRATESFFFEGPRGPVSIRKGETFHKESSRLEGLSDEALESNFEPFTPDHDIERATAAPGDRRKGRARQARSDDKSSTDAEAAPEESPGVSAEE